MLHLNSTEHFRAILYVHPWEVDPEQPRIAAHLRSRLRQYTGLSTTAGKLQRLLGDFRFAPIAESFAAEVANNFKHKVRTEGDPSARPYDRRVVDGPGGRSGQT
jgi:hypothetical protein